MAYATQLNRCFNTHGSDSIEFFDPETSDSEFPGCFCCSVCERDWVANRLQAITLLEAVDIQARASVRTSARSATAAG
jgi:hypothetical protein